MIPYSFLEGLFPFSLAIKQRKEGDILIVMNENLDIIYLNETSKFFFEQIDGKKTVANIYTSMLTNYDVKPCILKNDIVTLIRDMQWNSIIGLSRTAK